MSNFQQYLKYEQDLIQGDQIGRFLDDLINLEAHCDFLKWSSPEKWLYFQLLFSSFYMLTKTNSFQNMVLVEGVLMFQKLFDVDVLDF
jgi:hypothetical protein